MQYDLQALAQADIIIIPSWRNPAETAPAKLLLALNAAAARGAILVGLCLGAYVLAQAGLLNGKAATTHWAFADDFARRYPEVALNADVLYLQDGQIYTSAGTAAGLDCCLYLLRTMYGITVANTVARRLVVPPHRQGGQSQYIQALLPASAQHARLLELIEWVRLNLNLPHTLDSLADKA